MLGVDSSANLIQAASALSSTDASAPRFRVADVTDLEDASSSYDLVLCNHLMNDLPDPRGPIAEFARVLKPGGRIVILMLHPCFYNDRASRTNGDNREVASAYFTQRKVTQQFNVDGIISPAEVTSWHRPLEFYVQALQDAGLCLTDLQEPHPTGEQLRDDPWWQANFPRPLFLLLVAQKQNRE